MGRVVKQSRASLYMWLLITAAIFPTQVQAKQPGASDPEFDEILALDISDLTVTSVSKRAQKLNDTAAAIYVITQEDIRRSGVTNIPDALRLVPGMQVAKIGSNRWAISARGFNDATANKLLVMIDGRSIYTPVFSGTYWDDQSTMVQDIDRIEVIRGPGASLWGANAVNGIINIITKRSDETQGNLVSATGTLTGGLLEGRHGGKLNDNTYYRAYGQYLDAGASQNVSNNNNPDKWYRARSGFRMDTKKKGGDSYTFQGDVYGGQQNSRATIFSPTAPFSSSVIDEGTSYGGNLLGRWNHDISKDSQLSLQAYLDHYTRREQTNEQHVSTADIQLQHSIALNPRNNFIWGGGARIYYENIEGTYTASFDRAKQLHETLSAFLQNEYAIVPSELYWTLGSKFEHNDLSGFEVQPSTRLSWHPVKNQTIWGAVSRAVRTPSTYEEDVSLLAQITPGSPPTELRIVGNPNQKSEEVIAYELGHRIQPNRSLSFDTTIFYNEFDNLQTIATPGAIFTGASGNDVQPYMFNNLGSGHVWGGEIAANWNVYHNWRLTGSYSHLKMNLEVDPGSATTLTAIERRAPLNQFSIRSYWSVTDTVNWDNMFYYVDNITVPVGAYLRYDSRISWLVVPGTELSLIGRNLLDDSHPEFPTTPQTEIGRAFVAQIMWKF